MSAEELEEWRKMPPYDKVQHANWKCRKMGYEELQKELNKHKRNGPPWSEQTDSDEVLVISLSTIVSRK